MWSPQGTYLTTFHVPGIALWGGERFEKQGRFPHKDVKVRIRDYYEPRPLLDPRLKVLFCRMPRGGELLSRYRVVTIDSAECESGFRPSRLVSSSLTYQHSPGGGVLAL